jgi:hypothetical protein
MVAMAMAMAAVLPPAFGVTLTVTNLADSGAGTLRDRIAAAAPGDVINFSVFGTVLLNSQLTISKNLSIFGFSASLLKFSGNNNKRVFNVTSGTVLFWNVTISDGLVAGTNGLPGRNGENVRGGGVLVANSANLYLLSSIVSNNVVKGGQAGSGAFGGNGFGGGIGNLGTVTLDSCLVVSNSAFGGSGGAVDGGGQAWGGSLYTEGSANIYSATIHANSATGGPGGGGLGGGAGGGIYNAGTVSIIASTIVSNAAASMGLDFGGAIDNNGTLTVRDSTIVGNRADFGGGITSGDLGNIILAGNSAGTGPDGTGTIVSSDYNLIQNTNGITFTGTTTHNITGQNPLLGPLRFNNGPPLSFKQLTMTPLPGSPVIDKGNTLTSEDERAFPRPYDLPSVANAGGGNGSDIGAVEFLPTPELNIQHANNNNVVLFWSTDAADFHLERATNLPAASNWTVVTNTRALVANQVYVTNSAVGASAFYRLSFP